MALLLYFNYCLSPSWRTGQQEIKEDIVILKKKKIVKAAEAKVFRYFDQNVGSYISHNTSCCHIEMLNTMSLNSVPPTTQSFDCSPMNT